MIDKNKKSKTLKNVAGLGLIVLGTTGFGSSLLSDQYRNDIKYDNMLNQIPHLEEVVRYNVIGKELEDAPIVNGIFNKESREYFSNLQDERDSLALIENFDYSVAKYQSYNQGKKLDNTSLLTKGAFALISILSGFYIVGKKEEEK